MRAIQFDPGQRRLVFFDHLVTLSALASTFGGIVRPICFAVFRFIISANLVSCPFSRLLVDSHFAECYSEAHKKQSTSNTVGRRTDGNRECFPLRLLSFLVYEFNEFFAEALVSTRNLEDLGIAFFGQSFFYKRPLHL
jgi:hypothetical protein